MRDFFFINRSTRVKEQHVRSGRILPSNWRPIPLKLLVASSCRRPRLVLCPAFFNVTHAQGMNQHTSQHAPHADKLCWLYYTSWERVALCLGSSASIYTQSVNKHAPDSFFYVSVKTELAKKKKKICFSRLSTCRAYLFRFWINVVM